VADLHHDDGSGSGVSILKSGLGLKPIYHRKEERSDDHLFITILAYQAVQVIRRNLKECGVYESWLSLRKIFSVQQQVTVTFQQEDGRVLHVRKATVAVPPLNRGSPVRIAQSST